ncbi:hypothetical protein SAMN04515691_3644 [Leifsonia sp. 98AMF]|jgi:hypothetical protein|uniref:hypothetical protein n=1 Tax=Microbacteriaceae TaxID=85023 RepID=UPI0003632A09|nr:MULTISPECIES: hypothetical protein [Microbacteriaceae]TDQ02063.1 hypothetical protein AXZ95_0328 [Leifsonia sp. 115AMFTsu3.1]SDH03022.1 hypothetical protein SAMN04515690_0373 [Leifsonia sp. 197AMF]SDJ38368.1 hypothetical protein SAMN04515684_3409 [Leifsonia sp. 466MF]SDK40745.1 hypothetical protein SAMN04515683_3355 [Leifsonia sp. 157MF]SDN58410.1 hypothetical protein SAMN04515686_1595 [Leifsonia sp. 509MF]
MDFGDDVFTAFLVHPDQPGLDRSIDLPVLETHPPVRVRIPADQAMEVYELVTADDWPREAIYRHVGRESSAS